MRPHDLLRRFGLGTLAAALFLAQPALSQSDSWLGGAGNWFDPNNIDNGCTNWSSCPPPPAFNYNIFITAPSSAVTLNSTASVLNLTLGSGNSLIATGSSELNFGNTATVGTYALTLSNSGQIELAGDTNLNILNISGGGITSTTTLTITGSGTLTLDSASNSIGAFAGFASTLINQSTIQGQGAIGLGEVGLNNQGTINANVAGGTLTIQPNSNGMTNSGVLSATAGGILSLQMGDTTLTNTGGTISASSGSTVILGGGTYLGGTLLTSGSGTIETLGGGSNPMLESLTNQGNYQILSAGSTTLSGTITNNGTIQLLSQGGATYLFINGTVSLQGTGGVQLVDSASPNNFISGAGGQLDNLEDIAGAGAIGNGLTILNQGSIRAIYADNPLTLVDEGFTNLGVVRAQNGATLEIFSPAFNNQGTLQVDAGSTISFDGSYGFTNYSAPTNTLSGGTYLVAGTLQFNNAANGLVAIDTNAASITLNGPASAILDALGNNVLANLSTNTASGSFTIENGRNFTTAGDFSNDGAVTVGNGSTLDIGPGATGTYTQNGASSVTTIQTGGELSAAIVDFNGGHLNVNGTLDPVSLAVCTTCALTGTGTVAASVTNAGTVAPGASPATPGTLTITGDYTQSAAGALVIDLAGAGAGDYGVLKVDGEATLDGNVDFVAEDGFTPAAGDDFTFLDFTSESGAFSSVTLSDWTCPAGDTCTEVLSADSLSLDISGPIVGPPPSVPEPPTWLLQALGLVGLGVWRRRAAPSAA